MPKEDLKNAAVALQKYISHHPSPICFEKHYREYMIIALPFLEVLDNWPVKEMDRVVAKTICAKYYECLPYKRQHKENILSLLHKREMGASNTHCEKTLKPKQLYPRHTSGYFFSRSLSAAKLGSSAWPLLHSVSNLRHTFGKESKMLRPRQFEYHPSDPSLMVFGTLGGEIVVINHENGNMISYIPSMGTMSSVLGLCWLNKCPSKVCSHCSVSFKFVMLVQHYQVLNLLTFVLWHINLINLFIECGPSLRLWALEFDKRCVLRSF